jgi:dTDP-4-amino-4,6-dideoxygalactose transaminase
MEILAINGGKKAIDYNLPQWTDISGRDIGEEEKRLVLETLDSGHLGMVGGNKVKELQELWAKKCGVATAVAVSNGTAAIHTALIYIGIGPGDEVLVPCASDMGTVIAILLQNAIPVFVDVDPLTQNIDTADLAQKITPRAKAIIAVHMFGLPCDMDSVMAIAKKNNLLVVEDSCQAHFASYKGRLTGTIGDLGCFSFQQTKHVTAGEGGIVITNGDMRFGRKLQLCGDKGWPRDLYRDHYFLAPNYHMTELQAAVAIAQLGKIDKNLKNRRKAASALTECLKTAPGVIPPPEPEGYTHTYFAYQFLIDPDAFKVSRDEMIKAIQAEGLNIVPSYLPQPLYKYQFLQEKIFYNKEDCPLGCPFYKGKMDYTKVNCEKMEQACRTGFFLQWNEKLTQEHGRDMGRALTKVFNYYHK